MTVSTQKAEVMALTADEKEQRAAARRRGVETRHCVLRRMRYVTSGSNKSGAKEGCTLPAKNWKLAPIVAAAVFPSLMVSAPGLPYSC